MRKPMMIAALSVSIVFLFHGCAWFQINTTKSENQTTQTTDDENHAPKQSDLTIATEAPTEHPYTKQDIPQEIRETMWNVTISDRSLVSFDDLQYLTVTYYGYDGEYHVGHLIVDRKLADETLEIFQKLCEHQFPIEKMNLPDQYGGIDEKSMQDNNTSAFNDRPISGSGGLSYHQLGRAIDINPLYNPYIKFSNHDLQPKTAEAYLDRSKDFPGMITENSYCVKLFKEYGWTWGGDWETIKDYQHFEKRDR